jgi:protein-S-isoprenylcysteine O-methyltransferase Ste14
MLIVGHLVGFVMLVLILCVKVSAFSVIRPGHRTPSLFPSRLAVPGAQGLPQNGRRLVSSAIDKINVIVDKVERTGKLSGIVGHIREIVKSIMNNTRQRPFGEAGGRITTTALVLASFVAFGVPPVISYFIGAAAFPVWTTGCYWILASVWQLKECNTPYLAPCDNHRLVTDGLYEHVRHPMYGGLILACLGNALWTQSVERLVVTVALAFLLVSLHV